MGFNSGFKGLMWFTQRCGRFCQDSPKCNSVVCIIRLIVKAFLSHRTCWTNIPFCSKRFYPHATQSGRPHARQGVLESRRVMTLYCLPEGGEKKMEKQYHLQSDRHNYQLTACDRLMLGSWGGGRYIDCATYCPSRNL